MSAVKFKQQQPDFLVKAGNGVFLLKNVPVSVGIVIALFESASHKSRSSRCFFLHSQIMSTIEDEFAGAEDSDYCCSEDEDEAEDEGFFECDQDLPERGVKDETKAFLLQCYDNEGGIDKCGWSSKLTKSLCDKHPDKLGEEGSILRSRVQTLADHWKRTNKKSAEDFQKIRTNVLKKQTTTRKAKRTSDKSRNKKAPVTSSAAPSSPEPTTKKSVFSSSLGSPMFGTKRNISKKLF